MAVKIDRVEDEVMIQRDQDLVMNQVKIYYKCVKNSTTIMSYHQSVHRRGEDLTGK